MLKLKDGFLMREIAGETIVIPSGVELDGDMMITLNETGRFLWERLQKGTTVDALVADVLAEYDIEETAAREHVARFVEKLNEQGFFA